MPVLAAALLFFSAVPQSISFPTSDGAVISAHLYGSANRGLVLVHGGRFTKESWANQASALVENGFRVLAIDLRGFGQSTGPGQSDPYTAPLHLDVLAAVHYLHAHGCKTVSVVGGSMGGAAAGDASIASEPGEIDSVVFLAAAPNKAAAGLHSRSLFLVARDDANADGPRLRRIQPQYEQAPEPKQLVLLDGSAHAQFLFQTDQADRVMREILRFLTAP